MAAQLTSTNGPLRHGLMRWMTRASNPLPLPVSPSIRRDGGEVAPERRETSDSILERTAAMPGLCPAISSERFTGLGPYCSAGDDSTTTTTTTTVTTVTPPSVRQVFDFASADTGPRLA